MVYNGSMRFRFLPFLFILIFAISCGTTEQAGVEPAPAAPAPVSAPVTAPAPGMPPAPAPVPAPVPEPEPVPVLPAPLITAAVVQEKAYNGRPQSVTASCEPDIPLVIAYYNNPDDYWRIQNGFYDPPAEPGNYFVSVNCAPGYGYVLDHDILVDFRIVRAPVRLTADRFQSSVFNGNPRRVQVNADPVVPLSYSYYPTRSLRQAAYEAFMRPESERSLTSALQGFTRVESAPTEPGTYFVFVYFYGNDRYERACMEIDFEITPAVRRN